MRTPPGNTLSEHRVEDGEQFPHASHQRHLLGLSSIYEPLVKLLDGGIVSGCYQSRHVECFPDPGSATPHGTPASESARIPF